MPELTLYQILEVSPEASEAVIRAAYFRLAKIYHPDLKHGDQRPQDTEKFIEINRAYTVLCDQAKRQVYDLDLRARREAERTARPAEPAADEAGEEGAAPPQGEAKAEGASARRQSSTEAGRTLLAAEQLVEDQRFKAACRLLVELLRAEPDNATGLSLMGYALAAGGGNLHHARDCCRRASEMEPYNAQYLARLAFVYEVAGLQKLADRYYAEALRQDPTQPLARAKTGPPQARGKHAGSQSAAAEGGGLLAPLRSLLKR